MDAEKQILLNNDERLRDFRNKYSKVARIEIDDQYIYVRGLRFGEWIEVVKGTNFSVNDKGEPSEEIDDKVIAKYVLSAVEKVVEIKLMIND